MTPPVRYTITPHHPAAHLFRVTCRVEEPNAAGQVFRLPAWIPGSYMIREFSRNIVTLHAECDGRPVAVDKLDKHTWRATVPRGASSLTLTYDVYAWDLSVRAAHLDQRHGFFNGTSVFLAVEGRTERACSVDIRPPDGNAFKDWKVATTLAPARGEPGVARPMGFGRYRAENYDELVDHPVEMGNFTHVSFDAGGVRHEVAITGRNDCDTSRLCADLAKICTWHINLFGKPAPVDRYLFLITVVDEGYGGLEHRASTALLASRNDLPYAGMKDMSDGYKSLLGLCSHEYFHTWNVKRIKPAAFVPYDLGTENYTRLLWAFEGFTSYYDDLALVRSGAIRPQDYLGLLARTAGNVLRGSGRFRQSVAESSFDAWTKFYRQDENAANAIVSYYAKGALIALALDLRLRAGSDGRVSLDDVMRALWHQHGRDGVGVAEDGIFAIVAEVAEGTARGRGRKLADWLRRTVSGTDDVPLARLLKPFGIDYRLESAGPAPALGVKLGPDPREAKLAVVYDDGAAQIAGLSANDVLIAIDGLKVTRSNLDTMLARRKPGQRIDVHAFRGDELMHFVVELGKPPAEVVKLSMHDKPVPGARALRTGWLGG